MHRQGDMILVTGGEPLIQDIEGLLPLLKPFGRVHLETNGTLPVPPGFDWVVSSPKSEPVVAGSMERADEIKWLLDSEEDVGALDRFLADWKFGGIVSVQPLSLSEQATQIAYQAALDHGWRLSLQIHKLIQKP